MKVLVFVGGKHLLSLNLSYQTHKTVTYFVSLYILLPICVYLYIDSIYRLTIKFKNTGRWVIVLRTCHMQQKQVFGVGEIEPKALYP